MDSLAAVAASGNSPPVRSLACTEMSGSMRRREDAVRWPRRYKPAKTSSQRMGRPVQSSEWAKGVGSVLGQNRCALERITLTRVRWNSGSLVTGC